MQMRRLEYVLRGVKYDQAKTGRNKTRTRLPITLKLLRCIRAELMRDHGKHDNIMIWAACCTCFFGFCFDDGRLLTRERFVSECC